MIQTVPPLTSFPISRVLPDPSDNTLYFVRAVVRNGVTGATLSTVNLASLGSQIYSATYRTPALASAAPLFLTITTTVYTNAGYTVLSQNYGNDQDTIQVFDSTNLAIIQAQQIAAIVGGSITPGEGIDYKKIAKLFAKTLLDGMKEHSNRLGLIEEGVSALSLKDSAPSILEAMDAKHGEIKASLEVLGAKDVDLSSVIAVVASLGERMDSLEKTLDGRVSEFEPSMQTSLKDLYADVTDLIKKTESSSTEQLQAAIEPLTRKLNILMGPRYGCGFPVAVSKQKTMTT